MSRSNHRINALLAAAGAAATLALAPAASAQIKFRTVAVTGTPAPGVGPGPVFWNVDFGVGFPYLNNQGKAQFRAFLAGGGVTTANDGGVWSGPTGGLGLVAREGSPAPDVPPGQVFDTIFGPVPISGNGRAAIRAQLTGPGVVLGTNEWGIWGGLPGSMALAARSGSSAPGTGATFGGFGPPAVNSFGQVAFYGSLDLPVYNIGYWFGAPGSVVKLALQGEPAPELPPGVNYGFFLFSSTAPNIQLNSAGQVAFFGEVGGPGIGAANNFCFWGGTPGSLHLITREGNPAVGVGAGVNWGAIEQPVLTDSGAVAFRGFLTGPSVTGANDFGIWRGFILGVLDLVAREGGAAPGTTLGTVFSNLSSVPGPFGIPKMNNMNGVAFRAAISGPGVTPANDTGIWAHNLSGALTLVAREGDAAAGMPAGTVYTGFHSESPVLNNLNQVAFHASIGFDDGIWATDPYGAMHPVLRRWQIVEVEPGVMQTATGVWPISGRGVQDGTPTSFNDNGELVIRADFGSSTRIIIADVNDQCRPAVTDQPDPVSAAPGSPVSFSVATTGPGVHAYQWRRDGTTLVDGPAPGGGTISGATTPALSISGAWPPDTGVYDVQITNRCGTRTSAGAPLTFGGCYPDCDGDGLLTLADFGCFQTKFGLGDLYADCDGDALLTLADFGCFQTAFGIGCP